MAMEMRQELKLSQQLVMTPQLQQAIRLLQLSRMELADLVHEEMLENPILDDEMDLDQERSRERDELGSDAEQLHQLEGAGLIFSGVNPDLGLVEMIELVNHPHFIGCQFHPEFKSRPSLPHPLFARFIRAAVERQMSR